MKRYVMGFLFNNTGSEVVLIKKNRPEWQKGLYSGVGGHIEENESPLEAMIREFSEEIGIETSWRDWRQFALLNGVNEDFECFCFRAFHMTENIRGVKQMTDEKPLICEVKNVGVLHKTLGNTPWLIQVALDSVRSTGPRTMKPRPRRRSSWRAGWWPKKA